MQVNGNTLTPASRAKAKKLHYTWFNGEGDYPYSAGYVFDGADAKENFARQVYADHLNRLPAAHIEGNPYTIGEGTVIGGKGFGWFGNPPIRFPHIGGVRIGYEVELGSNVTIDRGALDDTVIGDHVKIDNGVHVGHNATIGERSILTAHCIIGGSATVGKDCWIGLGAIIKNQVTIGDGVTVGMGAIVLRDVPDGVTIVGNPARILEKT